MDAAAAEARGQVRAAIAAWNAPVDKDVAVLLTRNGRIPERQMTASAAWGHFKPRWVHLGRPSHPQQPGPA